MFSWFIAKRLLKSSGGENNLLSPAIVRIATGAVATGIAVMIISAAIVTGFQKEIRAKVIGFGAHIQLRKFDSNNSLEQPAIDRNMPLEKKLLNDPEIKHIQPFAEKAGILKVGNAIEGMLFKGVGRSFDLTFLQKHLIRGRMPVFPDSGKSQEVLISAMQAKILKLDVGKSFVMYFVQDPPKARKLKIAGIYDTGLGENDFDKIYIWGDIRIVQQLNHWEPHQVSGLEIIVRDFNRIEETDKRVYETIPGDWNTATIQARYPQIFAWLKLIDTNVYIIIGLMLVVSIINMVTCLLILILERARMVGILKVLGASNSVISYIFLKQAAVLIFRGLVIGNILGIGLCLIQYYTSAISLNKETYYLSSVPVNIEIFHLVLINIGAFLVCVTVMLLPTRIVSGIRPAKVIRFD